MSDVIRICIGSEPSQYVPCEVLKSSILRRTTRPVEFYESWNPTQGWHALCGKYHRTSGTLFSHWRWIAPELFPEKTGKVIYQDADQVCFCDIGELYDALDENHMIGAVIGAEGLFGDKVPAADHIETSVMVINLARCNWDPGYLMEEVKSGRMGYSKMMQANWLDRSEVLAIPAPFNHFNLYEEGRTKIIHFTRVRDQAWVVPNHKFAGVWQSELKATIAAGHLDVGAVKKEIRRGHVNEHYLKALK